MFKYLNTRVDDEWKLNDLQEKLLEIICDIDIFCAANNISYCLAFGSVLGAIRHNGFIPWDDDMDIYMTFEDYVKFKDKFQLEHQKKYIIQEWDKNDSYFTFAKVRMNGTTYIEETTKNYKNFHMGIGIDIFILHKSKNNVFTKFNQFIWSKYVVLKTIVDRGYKKNKGIWKYILPIIKILPHNFLVKHGLKRIYSCRDKETNYLFSSFGSEMYDKVFFDYDEIFPVEKVKFEKCELPIPKYYGKYLKQFYGNYMKLPDLDFIREHQHIMLYDVNKDYSYYMRDDRNEC